MSQRAVLRRKLRPFKKPEDAGMGRDLEEPEISPNVLQVKKKI